MKKTSIRQLYWYTMIYHKKEQMANLFINIILIQVKRLLTSDEEPFLYMNQKHHEFSNCSGKKA